MSARSDSDHWGSATARSGKIFIIPNGRWPLMGASCCSCQGAGVSGEGCGGAGDVGQPGGAAWPAWVVLSRMGIPLTHSLSRD
jgi:hypothetical protein